MLVGCNSVFGNDRVAAIPNADAQFFDAPIDAPPMCGANTPTFRNQLFEVPAPNNCQHYSVSENGVIVAICQPDTFMTLYNGQVSGTGLSPMASDLPSSGQPTAVRIAPEGDFALIQWYVAFDDDFYHAMQLTASNTWHDLGPITGIDPHSVTFLSTPTRGPARHIIGWDYVRGFTEFTGDGTDWTAQPSYIPAGFTQINSAFGLTPDGLRLVALASVGGGLPSARYASRTDMSQPFTTSAPLAEPASIFEPYLTEDCGALFFFGLDRILFVKQ